MTRDSYGMTEKPRIVFMGTPEFAVASLGSLLMNNYDVVGVVSAPDKAAGRGRNIRKSPVAMNALSNCLNLLQPPNLKDPEFLKQLSDLRPDLIVVVAFRLLPAHVWKIPPYGTINLHASLLPQYRGAAPINHAIINGEHYTGVTTFIIDEEIDTGKILMREKVAIGMNENAGDLHDRLMRTGAKLLITTIDKLLRKDIAAVPQDEFLNELNEIRIAPRIFPKDCIIDWSNRPDTVFNHIRGMAPYPGARTILEKEGKRTTLKILEAEIVDAKHSLEPGTIITDNKKKLIITVSGGQIKLRKVQAEGKKIMSIEEFMRGYDLSGYTIAKVLPA